MISKSIFVVLAVVGLALPTAGGAGILQPAAAQEFSIAEILDLALDFADLDLDETEDVGGASDGGDGSQQQVDANVQQQDSTQDRTQRESNVNQNIQSKNQRQVVVDEDTPGTG